MDSTYQKEFTISSYDLNPRGQARLTSMANFFQEIAYHHATQLGYGYEAMKERNTMWVLSRMKIRIHRYPEWKERIVIETWPSGTEKLFALRDFRVRDEKIYVKTFQPGKGGVEFLVFDLQGKLLSSSFLPDIKTELWDIRNNHFYYLNSNEDLEIWELHSIRIQ